MKQKSRRLLEALWVILLSVFFALAFAFLASVLSSGEARAGVPQRIAPSYRDSVYFRVIKDGSASLSCYLSYPLGGSAVLRDYGNNAYELGKLGEFVRKAFGDTLIYVRGIRVKGYCSVEGSYAVNERLARDRAVGFGRYLNAEYSLSRRYPMDTQWVGEDWARLRELVSASDLYERDEVLQIIDKIEVFGGREKLLMELNGGNAYRVMSRDFFHQLRRVEITVEYDLHRIIEERYRRKLTDAEFNALLEQERRAAQEQEQRLAAQERLLKEREESARLAAQEQLLKDREELERQLREVENKEQAAMQAEEELQAVAARKATEKARASYQQRREADKQKALERKKRRMLYPLIAIKTNLLPLGGLTPDMERTTFMPNLEGELFFGSRWSVAASALYAYWDFGQGEFWGVSAYTLEGRLWFNADGLHRGFYAGLYGRRGDFDIRRDAINGVTMDNKTGTYYEGGLSLGYSLSLSRHWILEASAGGGYRRVNDKFYDVQADKHYLTRDDKESKFTLTELGLKIGYRWGK